MSGTVCTVLNPYYSQCLRGTQPTTPNAPPSSPPPTSVPPTSAPPSQPTGGSSGLNNIPASQLYQFSNFGSNPNNVAMYVYKPKKVAANPPLIVASHCTFAVLFFPALSVVAEFISLCLQSAQALRSSTILARSSHSLPRRTATSLFSPLP